ncbi:hypothetical protein DFP72DRAFT_92316 [Ephemerocybe angulata]|uniref:Uncharacterized protein n=1 Tax=Ephemerocybe angulata TaxID=980116 RepID=A0A8H6M8P6_9AGAR|nr:hypothetical protein DFP72DRAFT_92316 [Tulosesus angulatus]
MSHTSPASYLIWTVITALVGLFLVFHLWSFDRFKCLKWNSGPYTGAFKRIMTYSYLFSVPMIFIYAAGYTVIKYREGYILHPVYGIIPKPHQLWDKSAHSAILPLNLVFSIAWGLEMVTHLEELCFWLFLVNSGSSQQDWFSSLYFKTWSAGSIVAVIYMPLVTIFTRSDPLKSEAYTFMAGSLGSLSLTLWFVPILWTFPGFLRNLRREGVDIATIVRLTKFSELNTIRVIFRFVFTVPLLILGIDGVRPHNHINESVFWTDFLVVLAGFGCSISSAITLVIFFPRSVEGEIAAADLKREKRQHGRSNGFQTPDPGHIQSLQYADQTNDHAASTVGDQYLLTSSPVKQAFSVQDFDGASPDTPKQYPIPLEDAKKWEDEGKAVPRALPQAPLRPNRRRGQDIELGGGLTESNLSMHNLHYRNVNPMVSNFTSPIDFAYQTQGTGVGMGSGNGSRLTFTRK